MTTQHFRIRFVGLIFFGLLSFVSGGCSLGPDSGVLEAHFNEAPEIPLKGTTRLKSSDLPEGSRVVRIGVSAAISEEVTLQRYQPVVNTMAEVLAVELQLVIAPTYSSLLESMAQGKLDLAVFSPQLFVVAQEKLKGLQPIVSQVALGVPFYSSFVVVRGDDPARDLDDLVGRNVAFVSERSASGFLFPYAAFLDAGLDPEEDFKKVFFAGSHLKAIRMLRTGQVDVIGTGSGIRRTARKVEGEDNPTSDFSLRVLAKAGRIPFDVLCASAAFPSTGVEKIHKAMRRMHARTAAGKSIWRATDKISAWIPVDDARYEEIRRVHKRVNAHRMKASEENH